MQRQGGRGRGLVEGFKPLGVTPALGPWLCDDAIGMYLTGRRCSLGQPLVQQLERDARHARLGPVRDLPCGCFGIFVEQMPSH